MYYMTVYDKNGEVLLNKPITAKTDQEARSEGYRCLEEKGYTGTPHRIFNATGRLLSFYPHQYKS